MKKIYFIRLPYDPKIKVFLIRADAEHFNSIFKKVNEAKKDLIIEEAKISDLTFGADINL